MSDASPFGGAVPSPAGLEPPTTAHKTIGILNILFGTVLLLTGGVLRSQCLFAVCACPRSGGHAKAGPGNDEGSGGAAEERDREVDGAGDGGDDGRREGRYQIRREALEAQPTATIPVVDYSSTMRDPRILGYGLVDVATGLVLNFVMLIAGIGLLRSRSWARKTGIWVAALKLLRLVVVYGYAIAVVGPVYSEKMSAMMEQMAAQMPQKGGGPPPQSSAIGCHRLHDHDDCHVCRDDSFRLHLSGHFLVGADAAESEAGLRRDCASGHPVIMSFFERLLGPLAFEECRRAMRPAWLRWLAVLAALPAVLVLLLVIWLCETFLRFEMTLWPGQVLLRGLVALGMLQMVVARLISPALLAGTIAGEKDRGTLGLLLISRQSAGQIVWARLLGRLSQAGLLVAAGLPPLVLLASLCQVTALRLALLVLLPAAVAYGGAGLALAASALSRRGRDALLAIYLLDVAIVVLTFLPNRGIDGDWLAINPLIALVDLLLRDTGAGQSYRWPFG